MMWYGPPDPARPAPRAAQIRCPQTGPPWTSFCGSEAALRGRKAGPSATATVFIHFSPACHVFVILLAQSLYHLSVVSHQGSAVNMATDDECLRVAREY